VQNSKLTPANIVILAAGVVMLIASFLAFYKVSFLGHSQSYSAWSTDIGLFGIALLPMLFGVIMAVHVALTAFANVNLPARPLGFTWNQVHLALAVQSLIMMLCFLVRDKSILDFGIGFWLLLLGSIALVVGAVMREREGASSAY
jgi:hypothetical protein